MTRTFELDLPTPEYRVAYLPAVDKGDLSVMLKPGKGMEVAAFAVHSFKLPGVNSAFVRPAGSDLGAQGGLLEPEPDAELGMGLEVLDIDDSSSVAAKVRGKVKQCAIYSNSIDPDRVQGQYFAATGSPLSAFDGVRFTDGKPKPWNAARSGMFFTKRGSRVMMDLTYRARAKLCATYERTLKQSEVMEGVAVLGRLKEQFEAGEEEKASGPEWATYGRCGLGGVYPNDQFFNVFDLGGAPIEELSVYVYGGDGREHGLSEIEMYD